MFLFQVPSWLGVEEVLVWWPEGSQSPTETQTNTRLCLERCGLIQLRHANNSQESHKYTPNLQHYIPQYSPQIFNI